MSVIYIPNGLTSGKSIMSILTECVIFVLNERPSWEEINVCI